MSHPQAPGSLYGPEADNHEEASISHKPMEESRSEPACASEPILCRHCGRTASNGISCEGTCVADSGY
ncbi:MAG: hypothetical protein VKK98_01590 [Cyanobacteriota bacterium]|nr:hypothetical protein [Cyanobacteriota bacterium]